MHIDRLLSRPVFLTKLRVVITLLFLINVSIAVAEAPPQTLRISAAKSFADTGLLQIITEKFNIKNPDIDIKIQAVGSLQALDHVRHAKADLVITHYPHEEKRLVTQGYATKRTQIMFSKYAVFGPPGDELGLAQKHNIIAVLHAIAEEEPPFVVSSPKGGTYRKIEELWALSGINPDWPDYEYTNLSSSAILRQAAEFDSYAISDMGTYLTSKEELSDNIVPLYQEDLALQNLYSVLIVKPQEGTT